MEGMLFDPRVISILRMALDAKDKIKVVSVDREVFGRTAVVYIVTENEKQASEVARLVDEVISIVFKNKGGGR